MRAHDAAERLMCRMRKISISIGFVGKSNEKAMREAPRFIFDADIGAPFEVLDGFDLGG